MKSDDKREAGRREAQLRELNERVADAIDDAAPGASCDDIHIMCECARGACEEMLDVPRATFERIRPMATHFIVVPGHVLHDVEESVEQGIGWMLVRKRGDAALGAVEELAT